METDSRRLARRGLGPLKLAVVAATIVAACRQPAPSPAAEASGEAYVPGLGEIMTLQQMRHTKLWLAGEAGNWELAAYEIKELQEGFDDVIAFHPTHEDAPVAPKDAIPRMVEVPVAELEKIVANEEAAGFEEAYDRVTQACNDCHDAMDFGFNRVQRPASNPYPDQVFAPAAR